MEFLDCLFFVSLTMLTALMIFSLFAGLVKMMGKSSDEDKLKDDDKWYDTWKD